ncbi:glycosyltransferase [Pleurocapsa sp. PCC 7319]|uniref:glycosyltransferase n=1 Tax=Pleurocapsa sp. PCC 7319 TaxID=118161 RepID=UPI000347113E|nr:glycosyltransferase [Pleurocapsa sp. PCC 7319]
MKITILTVGTRGDVQPFIALGLGLKQIGHTVTIVTHAIFESWIRSYGFDFAEIVGDPQGFIESEEGQKMLESGSNPIKFIRLLSDSMSPFVDSLMSDIWQVCQSTDAIIAHSILFWTYDLAYKLDIPYFLASFTPLSSTTKYPVSMGSGKSQGGLFNYLSYPLSLIIFWQIYKKPVNQWLESNLSMPSRSLWRSPFLSMRKQKVPFLYAYSNYVLPKPQNGRKDDYVTGYWFLNSATDWTPPDDLINFLGAGSPPVYIGFGSMSNRDPEATTKIAIAALEKTNQRGVISTGWGGISNIDLPDSIFKIDSVPHDWLFPRCTALVHHGGAGTTASGLKAGVPTIIVPFFSDQPFWGHRVADLGVGTEPIERKKLTVENLSAAIDLAIAQETLRDRANYLGQEIRSENGVDNAVKVINEYLASWREAPHLYYDSNECGMNRQ